jgi:hypothetical protein
VHYVAKKKHQKICQNVAGNSEEKKLEMQTWWLCKQCSVHILNDEILSFETKTTKTGKAPELKRSHWLRMPDSNWFPKLNFPLVGANGKYFVDQLTHLDM